MKIQNMKVIEIKPYPNNPRINDHAVNAVAESIKEFGFKVPIIIDADNVIVAGHTRLKAAERLELETVPVIIASDLTPDQIKAFRLADNKTGELAEIEMDMEGFGFDVPEVDFEGNTNDDDIPEEVEPVCKLGQIWKLGAHRIMCGDNTEKENVEKLMNGEKADMVFTDPPYGINLNTDFSSLSIAAKKKGGRYINGKKINIKPKNFIYKKVINDDKDYDPAIIFDNFGYCKEIFLWGADYYSERLKNKNKGTWFVWDKREGIESVEFSLSEFELCWSKNRHQRRIIRCRWFGFMGLENEDTKSRIHPTQKPIKLCIWFIEKYSKENNFIIDPFLGSGSTLIAAEKTNRICYGMEIDPHYCDVIIRRWEEYTGQKAELI